MKNLTLALDDTLLDEVRTIAANKKTTVNAMVREFLHHVAQQESRAESAMRELARMSERTNAKLGPVTWMRDELYDS